jgi:hypothetical protein
MVSVYAYHGWIEDLAIRHETIMAASSPKIKLPITAARCRAETPVS